MLENAPSLNQTPPEVSVPHRPFSADTWSFFMLFSLLSFLFIVTEIAYQYFFEENGALGSSLIRGGAYAGGTLIALSLFSSAVFKWYPKTARHWRIRRYLGVAGALSIIIHVASVIMLSFNGDITQIFYSLNLFQNALLLGFVAYVILLAMLVTSTDWAMKLMGGRRWKFLHRFIYIAFPASVFHYLMINPTIYRTVPGALLVITTIVASLGQIIWFFKTIKARHYRNAGTYVGSIIILAILFAAYRIFFTSR